MKYLLLLLLLSSCYKEPLIDGHWTGTRDSYSHTDRIDFDLKQVNNNIFGNYIYYDRIIDAEGYIRKDSIYITVYPIEDIKLVYCGIVSTNRIGGDYYSFIKGRLARKDKFEIYK